MYKLFYNLRNSPFSLSPDPDFLYLSAKHKNALAVLERSLVKWVGLSAITGEKGTGKSTLIQYLLKQSWPDVTFGLISESDNPPGGLLKRTLSAFGLNSFGKTTSESYDLLSDFMVIDCFWKKRQPVLIIDESLGIESRALEEVYMLSTMEPEENRNLRIILAMSPGLWETLKRPTWTHLARRVGNSYHLETLDYQETVDYVQHRLRVAGTQNESLFDDSAYKAIFRYSGGNPRLINVLCNAALVQGAIQEKPQIGAALIKNLIMQKLWLRAAITDPRGEVQGRSETEGKNVVQTAGVKSDTDNLRPAVDRLTRRDKTGQTVSEFIIADIDHASRKYARLDAEVSKASKHEPTDETSQGVDRRLLRVASIAVIVLITTAVAIFFFNRDRSSRESQLAQGDQDEASVSQGSLENSPQLVAEDKTHDTTLGSEAPLVSIEPVLEQSEPDSVQDEGPLSIERKGDTESVEPYIAELLARAEQQIAAKHLVTPAGDAALETYQSILELMPGHSGASQGINRIKDLYLAWARATRQRGLWAKAQSFAERAVTLDPQDTDAAQLLDQIKAERKLEAEVAALKQLEEERAEAAAAEDVKALRKPKVGALKKTTTQPVVPAQEPDTVASDLQAQRVSEVDNLLMKAQQQFVVQHLTQPAGDNAWEIYQKVLQLDSNNQRALEGLQRIAQRIESMAQDRQQNGDLLTSMAIIEEGLRVMPDHWGLLALKEEINRQLEAQRAAQQVEE